MKEKVRFYTDLWHALQGRRISKVMVDGAVIAIETGEFKKN